MNRVLLLHEQGFGGDIDEAILCGFEANGFDVTCAPRGMPWEPRYDIVIGYGPFSHECGHLLTVARQVLALPRKERPIFIWWLTENPPPQWIPVPLAAATSRLRMWADERLAHVSQSPAARWRRQLYRAHRLRVLGQLRWAWQQGSLSILVVTNQARARYYRAHGFEPLVVPLGYHGCYGQDLGLEREIDVAFIGQIHSKRRQRILPGLFEELSKRGISVAVADNMYGDERTRFLNRSKIMLNVLRAPQDFVGQRLALGAANRTLTVSEPMLDPYPFEAGQHMCMAPLRGLADAVENALQDEVTRHEMVDRAYRFVTEELTCDNMVRRVAAYALDSRRSRGAST
jgi:hypothetical protein